MDEIRDVVIIGGGASGMFAGILLAKAGMKVTILEHTKVSGKKLSLTGSGRCNYTNLFQSMDCYRGRHTKKAYSIIEEFDGKAIVEYFESLGILPNIRKGRDFDHPLAAYVYPLSFSGKDFVTVLNDELLNLKVKLKTNTAVTGIQKIDGIFEIETGEENSYIYRAKAVLIATGGLAMPSSGSDGSMNEILKKMGHIFIKPLPALTGLSPKTNIARELSGMRIEAELTSFIGSSEEILEKQAGEVQFSDRGISGIPAMNLSGRIAREIADGKRVILQIDFFPFLEQCDLEKMLQKRKIILPDREVDKFFLGLLPEKLAKLLLKEIGIKQKKVGDFSDDELRRLTLSLKRYKVPINGVLDFSFAQTTSGGISLGEVTDDLESTIVEKLFFAGEILDVDGLCGGYNLTWAWASAYRACRKIGEII